MIRPLSPVDESLSARRRLISVLLPYSCFLVLDSFDDDVFLSELLIGNASYIFITAVVVVLRHFFIN